QAHAARVLFGWARHSLRTLVTVGPRWLPGGYSLAQIRATGSGNGSVLADTRADDTAAILFTSGSTGVPKGAVYTHGIFSAQVDQLQSIFGIEPGEIDLCTFPLFALFAPALGMTSIIPRMDFTRPAKVNPREILEPARKF